MINRDKNKIVVFGALNMDLIVETPAARPVPGKRPKEPVSTPRRAARAAIRQWRRHASRTGSIVS